MARARRQAAGAAQPKTQSALEVPDGAVALPSAKGSKLSARLLELIEPYRDPHREDIETHEEMAMLTDAAALAWNIALLPSDEQQERIGQAVKGLPHHDPQAREAAREFLAALVKRKLKLFPNDDRGVANYRLTDRGGQWNLMVLSMRRAPGSGE